MRNNVIIFTDKDLNKNEVAFVLAQAGFTHDLSVKSIREFLIKESKKQVDK